MVTVTKYVWDPVFDCVTHELDENNAVKAVYNNEPQPYGGVLSQRRGTTSHYHHHDALGSTRFLTDSSSNVTDMYVYDAWGNSVASTGTTVNPFRWVGRYGYYQDASTGRVYVRARIYVPTVARWASPVPLHRLSSQWKFDGINGIRKVTNDMIPSRFLMKYALMNNRPSNGQDSERNPDDIPAKGGWFSLKSNSCADNQLYKECCCSSFQVKFRPDDDQIASYFSIELRVGVRTQRTFRGILSGTLCPSRDTGWVVDDPENELGGHAGWDYRRPSVAATWDDWPGDGPERGIISCCTSSICSLKTLKQEYEVCAIGTRKGVGAIRDPLGCIRYSHYCSTTISEIGGPHDAQPFWCMFDCFVHRTGSQSKVTPSPQIHYEGNLNESPFEIP